MIGTSYETFGGGRNEFVGNFGDRFDFDAVAYWEIRNLGAGEAAARLGARSRIDQARQEQIRTMDLIAREVVEAHARITARRQQIENAKQAIAQAEGSLRLNVERIRNAQGLPIEGLQAIQALEDTRREYLLSVVSYNEAQCQLYRALGCPIRDPGGATSPNDPQAGKPEESSSLASNERSHLQD